jgi:hypothetical protein
MCDVSRRIEGSPMPSRPRWSRLYLRAGLMLAVLLAVQGLVAAGAERTALQCGLVVGGFGAMLQWARRNRAALDHLDWCECASSRTTIRVIQSGRRQPPPTHYPGPLPGRDPEPLEALPVEAMDEAGREPIVGAKLS